MEDAIKARNDIYNIIWPKGGKKLIADFIDNEDVESAIKNNKDPAAKIPSSENPGTPQKAGGSYGGSPKDYYQTRQPRDTKPVRGGLANSGKNAIIGEKEEIQPKHLERKKPQEQKQGNKKNLLTKYKK